MLVGMLDPHQLLLGWFGKLWNISSSEIFASLCFQVLFCSFLSDKIFQVSLTIVQSITSYASPIHTCFCFSFKREINSQPPIYWSATKRLGYFTLITFLDSLLCQKKKRKVLASSGPLSTPTAFALQVHPMGSMSWDVMSESGSWESHGMETANRKEKH